MRISSANVDEFTHQLEAVHMRAGRLRERVNDWIEAAPAAPDQVALGKPAALLAASIAELEAAMEELLVANEELHQQADEIREMNQAVEAERQRYWDLFDAAPDGYLLTDTGGLIQEANRAACQLLGAPAGLLVGKPLVVFVDPQAQQEFYAVLRRAGQTAEVLDWEVRLHPTKGPPMEVAVKAAPARNHQDQLVGLRWLIRDITAGKRAEAELRHSRQQLRDLSSRLESTREEERTRIAREIHDELGQSLTGLKMDVDWLYRRIPEGTPDLTERAGQMARMIDTTLTSLRRIITDLRPSLLDDFGLRIALEWYCEDFQNRTGIRCEFISPLDEVPLNGEHATALFRMFQEMLTNVVRHARATQVQAALDREANTLILRVQDNGRGFNPDDPAKPATFGLVGMRERARFMAGEVAIASAPGQGTTVTARIPLGM